MQTTTAEYVADNSAVALALPTPASSNELQETLRPLLTVQPGEPVCTCVPDGAFAGSNVVVTAEYAAGVTSSADTASAAASMLDRTGLRI